MKVVGYFFALYIINHSFEICFLSHYFSSDDKLYQLIKKVPWKQNKPYNQGGDMYLIKYKRIVIYRKPTGVIAFDVLSPQETI